MGTTMVETYLNVTLGALRDAQEDVEVAKRAGRTEREAEETVLRMARDLSRAFGELSRDGHTVVVKRERGEPHLIRKVGGLNERGLVVAYSEHAKSDVAPNACILPLATQIDVQYKPGSEQIVWTVDFEFSESVGYDRRDQIRDALGSATPHAFGVGLPFFRERLDSQYFRVFTDEADARIFVQRLKAYSEVVQDSVRLEERVDPDGP